jgi:pyruvate/2-oxoglutarate dehydrogenase complex dihydrolipoamide acyltransferase (E2) component
MFGISEFSAVINAPQACILAVGSGVQRMMPPLPGSPTKKPRIRTTLAVTLSADRRVLDEAMAAQFIQVR